MVDIPHNVSKMMASDAVLNQASDAKNRCLPEFAEMIDNEVSRTLAAIETAETPYELTIPFLTRMSAIANASDNVKRCPRAKNEVLNAAAEFCEDSLASDSLNVNSLELMRNVSAIVLRYQ